MLLFLVSIFVVFLGLFCGLAIGLLAEEELVLGKKYLIFFRTVLFFVSLIIFACSILIKGLFVPALVVVVLTLLFYMNKERFTIYYYLLAIMLCFAWIYNFFIILGPIAFLYGFPQGSLYILEQKNRKLFKQIIGLLAKHSGFVIIVIFAVVLGLF